MSTTCAICHRTHPGGAPTCATCLHRLRATLTELRHQLVLLRATLEPGATAPAPGATGRGRAHAPLPVRLDVLSLLGPAAPGPIRSHHGDQTGPTPILAVLQDWAQHTAREYAATNSRARWPHLTTSGQCLAYLTARITYAAAQPWIADLAADLTEVRRSIRAITRTQPTTRPLPAPCPCGAFGLTETDWADHIHCTVCERLLTPEEYRQHAADVMPRLHMLGILIVAAGTTTPGPTEPGNAA